MPAGDRQCTSRTVQTFPRLLSPSLTFLPLLSPSLAFSHPPGERQCTSRTIKNSLNPTWNQTLSLNVRSLRESLILKVCDPNTFGKAATYIGQALVPLQDLPHDGQPMGFDLTLQQRSQSRNGASVAIELTFNPLT